MPERRNDKDSQSFFKMGSAAIIQTVHGRGTDWFNHGVEVESTLWTSVPLCMCVPWRNGPVKVLNEHQTGVSSLLGKTNLSTAFDTFPAKYRRKLSGRTGRKIEMDGGRYTLKGNEYLHIYFLFFLLSVLSVCLQGPFWDLLLRNSISNQSYFSVLLNITVKGVVVLQLQPYVWLEITWQNKLMHLL